jgi:hypothetical protein
MLDSAGFMEPLRRTNQAVPDCQYLSKGRYTIINRPPTNEEDELLKRLLGVTSTKVGIFHYATVQTTKFRDISIEDQTMREKASIVQINNAICKIIYFINAIIGDKNHELAFVECYGNPETSEDSQCKFVLLNTAVNRIFSVTQMSGPLIHVTDNDKIMFL